MKKIMIIALLLLETNANACNKPVVTEPNKIVCKREISIKRGKKVIKKVCKTEKEWAESIRGCEIPLIQLSERF